MVEGLGAPNYLYLSFFANAFTTNLLWALWSEIFWEYYFLLQVWIERVDLFKIWEQPRIRWFTILRLSGRRSFYWVGPTVPAPKRFILREFHCVRSDRDFTFYEQQRMGNHEQQWTNFLRNTQFSSRSQWEGLRNFSLSCYEYSFGFITQTAWALYLLLSSTGYNTFRCW